MAGELIPRPKEEIESWAQPNILPARRQDYYPPLPSAEPAPQIQNVYVLPEESLLSALAEDLSRPFPMLIWGAVLVGIYLSGWWMLAAGFVKIGMLIFAALFATAPHARKVLIVAAVLVLGAAFIIALMRNPAPPSAPVTGVVEQAPVAADAPAVKTRKRHPGTAEEKR